MSDAKVRQLQRNGEHAKALRELVRTHQLFPSYTSAREVPCGTCRTCYAGGRLKPDCNGTGSLPFDPMNLVQVRAYLGDKIAREISECLVVYDIAAECTCGDSCDRYTLVHWMQGLQKLTTKLPVAPHNVPADEYLMIFAAHAAIEHKLKAGNDIWFDNFFVLEDWINNPESKNKYKIISNPYKLAWQDIERVFTEPRGPGVFEVIQAAEVEGTREAIAKALLEVL